MFSGQEIIRPINGAHSTRSTNFDISKVMNNDLKMVTPLRFCKGSNERYEYIDDGSLASKIDYLSS